MLQVMLSEASCETSNTWTLEPNADFNGLVNISYNISDGTDETPVTNSFRLIAINDAPVLDPDEQVQLGDATEELHLHH